MKKLLNISLAISSLVLANGVFADPVDDLFAAIKTNKACNVNAVLCEHSFNGRFIFNEYAGDVENRINDVRELDGASYSPIGYAVYTTHNLEIVRLLLSYGANPNDRSVSFEYGFDGAANLNVNKVNDAHLLLVAYYKNIGNCDMINLLKAWGANIGDAMIDCPEVFLPGLKMLDY